MSGGAVIQLASRGDADVSLTENPTYSHFKGSYHRHTPFSSFWHQQVAFGDFRWGGKATVNIDRVGDLLHRCVLSATFKKKDRITNYPIEGLCDSIELWIGGTLVDRHTPNFYRIYDECMRAEDQRESYRALADCIEESPGSFTTLYLPLIFFFCRETSTQSLPLCALAYHGVQIVFNFAQRAPLGVEPEFPSQLRFLTEYYILDAPERSYFAKEPLMYKIDQVQTLREPISLSSERQLTHRINLDFNHPVSSILFACHDGETHGIFTGSGQSLEPREVYAPVAGISLTVNGHVRYPLLPGSFYRLVENFSKRHQVPSAGVYALHFAINPASEQPSGSINCSRLDHIVLTLKMKKADATAAGHAGFHLIERPDDVTVADTVNRVKYVDVFAINYNWLRIENGVSGLMFSN